MALLRSTFLRLIISSMLLSHVVAKVIDVDQRLMAISLGDASKDGSETVDGGIVDLIDPVMRLNRFSFHKAVIEDDTNDVANWIVLFCPAWYEPCQALEPIYRQLTEKWQGQLNSALLSQEVRFAAVDCATEKETCNTQNVGMNYPFIAHYRKNQQVAVWRGKSFEADEQRLVGWLQKRLGGAASAPGASESEDGLSEETPAIPTDLLLVFAVIAGNAFLMSRGGPGADAKSKPGQVL